MRRTQFLISMFQSLNIYVLRPLLLSLIIFIFSSTVGKVFVLVEGQNTVKSGSAFFVSPTVLCTAGHVGYIPQPEKLFTPARVATSVELIKKQGDYLYIVSELGKGTVH